MGTSDDLLAAFEAIRDAARLADRAKNQIEQYLADREPPGLLLLEILRHDLGNQLQILFNGQHAVDALMRNYRAAVEEDREPLMPPKEDPS